MIVTSIPRCRTEGVVEPWYIALLKSWQTMVICLVSTGVVFGTFKYFERRRRAHELWLKNNGRPTLAAVIRQNVLADVPQPDTVVVACRGNVGGREMPQVMKIGRFAQQDSDGAVWLSHAVGLEKFDNQTTPTRERALRYLPHFLVAAPPVVDWWQSNPGMQLQSCGAHQNLCPTPKPAQDAPERRWICPLCGTQYHRAWLGRSTLWVPDTSVLNQLVVGAMWLGGLLAIAGLTHITTTDGWAQFWTGTILAVAASGAHTVLYFLDSGWRKPSTHFYPV